MCVWQFVDKYSKHKYLIHKRILMSLARLLRDRQSSQRIQVCTRLPGSDSKDHKDFHLQAHINTQLLLFYFIYIIKWA